MAKYTFWQGDGISYGRVDAFPQPEDFLRRIYAVTPEEDEEHGFYEDWKEDHPLDQFMAENIGRVKRTWYRYSFMEGGELCLDYAKPGRGAFELWTWTMSW